MEEVEEGSEPAEVLKALGPQDKKAYDCMLEGKGGGVGVLEGS